MDDPLLNFIDELYGNAVAKLFGDDDQTEQWFDRFRALPVTEREAFIEGLTAFHDDEMVDAGEVHFPALVHCHPDCPLYLRDHDETGTGECDCGNVEAVCRRCVADGRVTVCMECERDA